VTVSLVRMHSGKGLVKNGPANKYSDLIQQTTPRLTVGRATARFRREKNGPYRVLFTARGSTSLGSARIRFR